VWAVIGTSSGWRLRWGKISAYMCCCHYRVTGSVGDVWPYVFFVVAFNVRLKHKIFYTPRVSTSGHVRHTSLSLGTSRWRAARRAVPGHRSLAHHVRGGDFFDLRFERITDLNGSAHESMLQILGEKESAVL
jgi:hypothetical protein